MVRRILSFQRSNLWLLLLPLVLMGCANQQSPRMQMDRELAGASHPSNEQLQETIEKLRSESQELVISNKMYRRKMSLTFENELNHLTEHQKKVISLFFQTLPESESISIILSIAPSAETGFEAIKDAWIRTQELKTYLDQYSEEIEELYIPDQESNTVTIQVLGGGSV